MESIVSGLSIDISWLVARFDDSGVSFDLVDAIGPEFGHDHSLSSDFFRIFSFLRVLEDLVKRNSRFDDLAVAIVVKRRYLVGGLARPARNFDAVAVVCE